MVALVGGVLFLSAGQAAQPSAGIVPVVMAIPGEPGLNALHVDFGFTGRGRPELPASAPKPRPVRLPTSGTFEERLSAARGGPLGGLEPRTLYWVEGTRLFLFFTPGPAGPTGATEPPHDVLADRDHGTGAASAAVGRNYGTAPDALLVMVFGDPEASFDWLADQQSWIDVVSTSHITTYGYYQDPDSFTCVEGRGISRLTSGGRPVFAGIGNGEMVGHLNPPSGHPDAFHVGGVDQDGRTFLPLRDGSVDSSYSPNRPYDAGELFRFQAAHPSRLDGGAGFGGTSGASPRMAGNAARLIGVARALLGDDQTTGRSGASLAVNDPKTDRSIARGPLSDGDLTAIELEDLMRATATPAEPPGTARYFVEGYGAVTRDSIGLAERVLAGETEPPSRPDEDANHQRTQSARKALFSELRCPS